MQIRKPFDSPVRVSTSPGDDKVPQYVAITDSQGGRVLKETGSYSQSEYINSFKDSVLLENILQKCMITGDDSFLRTREGQYVDLTGMPRDFAEVQQRIAEARSFYDFAPTDVRSKYGSFEDFSSAMLSDPDSPDFKALCIALGLPALDAPDAPDVSVTSTDEGGSV